MFVVLLLASLFIDSNIISAPLVFVFSLLVMRRLLLAKDVEKKKSYMYTSHKSEKIYTIFPLILCFLSLFAIDSIRMQKVGISPLFFLISVLLIILYSRFFELSKSLFFAGFLSITVCIYAYMTQYDIRSTVLFLASLLLARWIYSLMRKK